MRNGCISNTISSSNFHSENNAKTDKQNYLCRLCYTYYTYARIWFSKMLTLKQSYCLMETVHNTFVLHYNISINFDISVYGESSQKIGFSNRMRVFDCPYMILVRIVYSMSCKCSFITENIYWKSKRAYRWLLCIYKEELFREDPRLAQASYFVQ